jgi:WD40 repeat protein
VRSVDVLPGGHRTRGAPCAGETAVAAAFTGDGAALLVGTVAGDGLHPCPEVATPARVRLLELPGARVRWELRGVQASAASFGPDGTLAVALALRPGEPGDANPSTVLRLDPRTGAPVDRVAGHRAPLTVLRFSPDGSTLFSGDAAGTWKRWALETGKETASATQPEGAILDLRLLPDARVLTQHEDDGVRQWRADGALISVLVPPPQADPVALLPACRAERDETRAALVSMKPRPSPVPLRDPGAYAGVTMLPELVVSPDAETVLVPVAEESCVSLSQNGCPSGCQRSYHLERVALRTGRTVQTLEVDEELLGGCVPPGGAFVTRGDRAGIDVWSSSGTLEGRIGVVLGKVTACEATPDGRRMLVATPRSLSVWDASAFNAPVEAVPRRARSPGPVAFSPRGDLSVDVDGGELRLRHWPRGGFVARLPLGAHDDAPTAMAFSPDGQTLAVGTARGVIYLYAVDGDGRTAQQTR